tara:strand:+ start:1431 stop:1589 length:159 start_codon:yes stop_codon:yes gene_type:complete
MGTIIICPIINLYYNIIIYYKIKWRGMVSKIKVRIDLGDKKKPQSPSRTLRF